MNIPFPKIFLFSLLLLISSQNLVAARISLEQYTAKLQLVLVIAEEVIEGEDFSQLEDHLASLPEKITLNYALSNDESAIQTVSNNWLKNYFDNNSRPDEEGTLNTGRALNNLIYILNQEIIRLENQGDFRLNDAEMQSKAKKILAEDIYSFEDEQDEKDSDAGQGSFWFSEFIDKIWQYLDLIFGILGLAMLALLLARAAKWIDFRKKPEELQLSVAGGLLGESDPRDSVSLRDRAESFLKKGALDQAVRYYYLAFILQLHESTLIRFNPSLTNWEYHALLKNHRFPTAPADSVTRIFDDSHYGEKLVSKSLFTRFQADLKSLETSLETRIRKVPSKE